jgi:hypothetical protein
MKPAASRPLCLQHLEALGKAPGALRHEGGISSASRPQKYTCDEAALYAVKFRENQHRDGKGIFTEEVVARVGRLIGAPVARVELVRVSEELTNTLRS